jgi:hypothetical protein
MKQAKFFLMMFILFAVMAFAVSPAAAGLVKTGLFQINVYSEEDVSWNASANDGYNSTWYKYPQNSPPFWNQWWYDDPYIKPGGKWVEVSFNYGLINAAQPGLVHVTINWTNELWVGQNAPPSWLNTGAEGPEKYIVRLPGWDFQLDPGALNGSWTSGKYWLPIDYNPEWISVDVQGMGNVGIWNGVIDHQCVPLPGVFWLFSSGLLGIVGIRRKMKK